MCDCLVFGSDGRIVLVELKNTVQHANKIFEKFRNSVAASLNIAAEADSKARCVALVLLAKKHGRNTEHIAITSRWIAGKYRINTGRCGDPLAKFADCGT